MKGAISDMTRVDLSNPSANEDWPPRPWKARATDGGRNRAWAEMLSLLVAIPQLHGAWFAGRYTQSL